MLHLRVLAIGILASAAISQTQPMHRTRLAAGSHYVKLNDIRIWYSVSGKGPLLVLQAPGWGCGSDYLRRGLAPLTKHFTVISYDPRGSGRSSRPSNVESMGTAQRVDDLEALRRYWGLRSLTVLGHSDGGAIALGYAIRYPTKIRELILVDSNIEDYDSARLVQQEIDARRNDPRFRDAISALERSPVWKTDEDMQAWLMAILPLYFYDPAKGIPRFKQTWTTKPSLWCHNAWEESTHKNPFREADYLNRVKARTLIIAGRYDWGCPPPVAEKIHTGIKDSSLVFFDKSGHMPWLEEPSAFFQRVLTFAAK